MLVENISEIKPVLDLDAKLLEHLERLHYRVEERGRIRSRSGVEHTFDILACNHNGMIPHAPGINVMITRVVEVGDPTKLTQDLFRG